MLDSWETTLERHIPKEARKGQYGIASVSYPWEHDPDHSKAWYSVQHGEVDYAEVRSGRPGRALAFRAWRIGPNSWAWQTPMMAAPAFATYTDHDPLVTDNFGSYCPGCRS